MIRTHVDKAARYRITATAKLQWLKGNAAPYFSLTADGRDRGSEFGGCCHDEILKHWPDLAPLVALHLSDIDGVPMHANAWYWMAGALGGAGEQYHGGNTNLHWPCEAPADKPRNTTEYRHGTPDEVLTIFAKRVRVSIEEATALREEIKARWNWPDMKTYLAQWIETQKPRWKVEADAAIEQFSLVRPGESE